MNAHEAYIGLNMIEGLGPVRVRAMVEVLGSPEAVFSAGPHDLMGVNGVGHEICEKILAQRDRVDPVGELDRARREGARILTPLDEDYPEMLKKIHNPPLALYVLGELHKRDRHAIAIVGSRRCTTYGKSTADRFGYQLAQTGFTVNSGLARGIDTAAHCGALKAKGRTIAVLGGALDKLYPPEAGQMAENIAANGAVLSEFPFGKEPDRTTFPYRNRIVSGMSMGVLVVEAGVNSGALHTVDNATEQGKLVFAVPGRIDSPACRGSNQLIKQGAKLVDNVNDILEEFEYLTSMRQEPANRPGLKLNETEEKIVHVLCEGELNIDALCRRTGLNCAQINGLLLGLEMKRLIRMLPGRRVALAGQT